MTAVDVVVIGGGIQGLVLLDALRAVGYSCALVTEGDLGEGQTLHSHGFLNTGFGQLGPELPLAARDVVHPYLEEHGVELSENWSVIPPPGVPGFGDLPPADLPPGFSRDLSRQARKLPARTFAKRQLVAALSRGVIDRIVRGSVTGFRGREPVETVEIQPADGRGSFEIAARAFVVAAGCGSRRLLLDLVGPTPQLERIKHRVVQMLCVRAPSGQLPAVSLLALPLGVMLAAHQQGDGVTWYVTPMVMGGPSFAEVPNDASAQVDPALLARASEALVSLFPTLPETRGLQVGCYAGFRQDIGDQPGMRLCEPVVGAGNVIAALPSGLVAPWLNAADAVRLLEGLVSPGGGAASGESASGQLGALPGRGEGVSVGRAVEDRPGFAWMSWAEWIAAMRTGPGSAPAR